MQLGAARFCRPSRGYGVRADAPTARAVGYILPPLRGSIARPGFCG